MSNLHRILVPAGVANALTPATALFEAYIVKQVGGFTYTAARGAWADDTGNVIHEPIAQYDIACTGAQFNSIIERARKLWPKEQCFFAAHIGEAWLTR